jgi:hypothetical protein
VNLIRKYFVDNVPDLDSYLYLPKSAEVPSMKHLGHITYQIHFMNFVGAVFVGFGILGMLAPMWQWLGASVAVIAYFCVYKFVRKQILGRFSQNK